MEEIQAVHRQEDHSTVHSVEVELSGDDPALPTVNKLDGSIYGSDIDCEGAESNSEEHRLHFLVQEVVTSGWFVIRTLEGLVVDVTEEELDGEDHVDGDGEHLEDNATQHDSATLSWIPIVTSSDGGERTTNTLNGKRDKVSGEKDDGI